MRRIEILVACALVLLVVGALVFTQKPGTLEISPTPRPSAIPSVPLTPSMIVMPSDSTFSGESTCLPNRDTSGPQTLECAFGLRAEDGKYYAVDTTELSEEDMKIFQTAQYISLTGVMTPIEMLSSDHWQKYNVTGIIQAKTVKKTK